MDGKFKSIKHVKQRDKVKSRGFIRETVADRLNIPLVLIMLIIGFAATIKEYFIPSTGVSSSAKMITNNTSTPQSFALSYVIDTTQLQSVTYSFTVNNCMSNYSAYNAISFGFITQNDSIYNNVSIASHPVTPPFYSFNTGLRDSNGNGTRNIQFVNDNMLRVNDKITIQFDTMKQRISYWTNDNIKSKILISNNILIGNEIKYKAFVMLPSIGDCIELSDFNINYYKEHASIVHTPVQDMASWDRCHTFSHYCECCDVKWTKWSEYKAHILGSAKYTEDDWRYCDKKRDRMVHDFKDELVKPFVCNCKMDDIRCTYDTYNPYYMTDHISNTHCNSEITITPTDIDESNVLPKAEDATHANTYTTDVNCLKCDGYFVDYDSYVNNVKICFGETTNTNGKKETNYKCNLPLKKGKKCEYESKTIANLVKHLASNKHTKKALPHKCLVQTNGKQCTQRFGIKSTLFNHINKYYGGKNIINKNNENKNK